MPLWMGAARTTRPSGSRVASPGYVIRGAPVAANWFEAGSQMTALEMQTMSARPSRRAVTVLRVVSQK
jgi:hypothetical protein